MGDEARCIYHGLLRLHLLLLQPHHHRLSSVSIPHPRSTGHDDAAATERTILLQALKKCCVQGLFSQAMAILSSDSIFEGVKMNIPNSLVKLRLVVSLCHVNFLIKNHESIPFLHWYTIAKITEILKRSRPEAFHSHVRCDAHMPGGSI